MKLVAARPADGMTAVYFPEGSTASNFLSGSRVVSASSLPGAKGR